MLVRTTFIFSPHSCCVMFSRSMRRRHSYSSTVKTTGIAAGHSPRGANRVFSGRQQTFLHFFGRGIAIPAYCRTNLFSPHWFSDTVALHISSAECEWRGGLRSTSRLCRYGETSRASIRASSFSRTFFLCSRHSVPSPHAQRAPGFRQCRPGPRSAPEHDRAPMRRNGPRCRLPAISTSLCRAMRTSLLLIYAVNLS